MINVQIAEKKTKLSLLREISGNFSSKAFNAVADRIDKLYKLGSNYEAYDGVVPIQLTNFDYISGFNNPIKLYTNFCLT